MATGAGFLLAVVVSLGIVAERVMPGDPFASAVATTLAIAAAIGAFLALQRADSTSDRRADLDVSGSRRVALVHALGAVAGIAVVHVLLRATLLPRFGWLREYPRQWVNDFVAVFGILLVVWGCVRRPARFWLIAVGAGVVAAYLCTSSHWHLDASVSFHKSSVQKLVTAQIAGATLCIALLRTRAPDSGAKRRDAPLLRVSSASTGAVPAQDDEARGFDGMLLLALALVALALLAQLR